MRKLVILLAGLLLATTAAAGDIVRFGSRVISVGSPSGLVWEVAGKPDRIVTLENKLGAAVGERFEYYRNGKTITITMSGGTVQAVSERY